jgi:hypothetical protein
LLQRLQHREPFLVRRARRQGVVGRGPLAVLVEPLLPAFPQSVDLVEQRAVPAALPVQREPEPGLGQAVQRELGERVDEALHPVVDLRHQVVLVGHRVAEQRAELFAQCAQPVERRGQPVADVGQPRGAVGGDRRRGRVHRVVRQDEIRRAQRAGREQQRAQMPHEGAGLEQRAREAGRACGEVDAGGAVRPHRAHQVPGDEVVQGAHRLLALGGQQVQQVDGLQLEVLLGHDHGRVEPRAVGQPHDDADLLRRRQQARQPVVDRRFRTGPRGGGHGRERRVGGSTRRR